MNVGDLLHYSSDEELSSLIGIIHDELLRRRKQAIIDKVKSLPPLTDKEKTLSHASFSGGIMAYRVRTQLSLADSKLAVDAYLGR